MKRRLMQYATARFGRDGTPSRGDRVHTDRSIACRQKAPGTLTVCRAAVVADFKSRGPARRAPPG